MVSLSGSALPAAESTSSTAPASPEQIARFFAEIVADAIPRTYERREDWGTTKRITVGLKTTGGGFHIKIRRRKKDVDHGLWKHYRVTMLDPDRNLDVRIENLRSLQPGTIGFTLYVKSYLNAWARARVYNRGLHLGTYTAEGRSNVRLWIDCEVSLRAVPGSLFAGLAIDPRVVDARVTLDGLRIHRIGEARGPLIKELDHGLAHLIEDELEGPELVAKLNRAIDKRREHLTITPDRWFPLDSTSPPITSTP